MSDQATALVHAVREHQAGRLASAETAYREVLTASPDHADASHLLGVVLQQQQRHDEAIGFIRRAIELNDRSWSMHSNLGCALQELGRFDEALAHHRRAVELAPGSVVVHSNLGTALEEAGRLEEAAAAYREALRLAPGHAPAHYNLGNLLRRQGRTDEAIGCYERALRLHPDYSEAHVNLAALVGEQGQIDEAIRSYRWALEVRPNNPEAHYNLGRALDQKRCWDEAIACYNEAIRLCPDHAEARVGRALTWLRLGNFADGWPEYHWRWRQEHEPPLRQLPYPLWDGSSLSGRTIFIHGEQGLGDEIMFGTCLPDVIADAGHCIIECDPRLVPLYARSFDTATVHACEGRDRHEWLAQMQPVDVYLPVGELPRYYRGSIDRFPRRRQLLHADSSRVQAWAARVAALGEGLRVGISWRSTGNRPQMRDRGTTLAQWEPLLRLPGIQFVSLQYGDVRGELEQVSRQLGVPIHTWDDLDATNDLDELAALMANLDLVVSVANITVHLAAALGAEVWAMLSANPSWRWMEDRTDSPWYPTLRLFRQSPDGGWDAQFDEVRAALVQRRDQSRDSRDAAPGPRCDTQPRPDQTARTKMPKPSAVSPPKNVRITDRRLKLHHVTLAEAYDQAIASHRQGDFVRAEGIYRELLRHQPQQPWVLEMLGVLARDTGRLQMAVDLLRQAQSLMPEKPLFMANLGAALVDVGEQDEAERYLVEAVQRGPECVEAHVNLGALYERQGRLDEALPICLRGVELAPDKPAAFYNLANVHLHLGNLDEAIRCYEQLLQLAPDIAKGHWNLGLTHLLMGNFRVGWEGYQWREASGQVEIDPYPQPLWDGSSLAGKTILIHAEQGVGDEIMFASCYPEIIAQAGKVVLLCEPRLARLFARSFPEAVVHGVRRRKPALWQPPEAIDVQIPAGSLPRYLRPTWESFPRAEKYLKADAVSTRLWRERFDQIGPGLKVGISWRAGGRASEQRRRTTQLDAWLPLLSVPGVHWINLQYGDCAADLAAVKERYGIDIHDWDDVDPMRDLDSVAAEIAALDLVISVGNTTVHMAGALGIEAWTALPHVPGWRWLIDHDEMPWYRTVRLFRQPKRNDWETLFAMLAERLRAEVERRGISAAAAPPARLVSNMPTANASTTDTADAADDSASRWVPTIEPQQHAPPPLLPALADAIELHQAGQLDRAERIYGEILDSQPRHPDALQLLGTLAYQTGRVEMAIDAIRRSLAECEDQPLAHYNLANALRDAGQLDTAIQHYQRAVALEPQLAEAHLNLGMVLKAQGQLDEAMACYQRALLARPGYAEAHFNLGCASVDRGLIGQAMGHFQEAVAIEPDFAGAHLALAGISRQLGRLDEALAGYDRVLAIDADHADAHVQRAMLLLHRGQFAAGWQEWEWRWRCGQSPKQRTFTEPLWDGSPLAERTILVHGEQGIGDELMFASCLPDVISEARHVVIECEPRLAVLMARSFPTATIQPRISWRENDWLAHVPAIDVQIPAGSVPRYLRTTQSSFPRHDGYLVADPLLRRSWRRRLDGLGDRPKIGISWRAKPIAQEPDRSTPLDLWQPLWRISDVDFVSLQYGDPTAELDKVRRESGVEVRHWDEIAAGQDFETLAALVAELDLVITIGNTTAHLAGALGVPVWTIVSFAPSWRWLEGRADSPWYPSMRVVQQPPMTEWPVVFEHLGQSLGEWLEGRAHGRLHRRPLTRLTTV